MTNKVLELDSVIHGDSDNLAKELAGKYRRIRVQRGGWEREVNEVRDYTFSTDTRTTTNSSNPHSNTTTIPQLARIRDNLHANYMDSIFPNEEWLVWDGDDEDSVAKDKRRVIEAYTKNKALQSGLRETMSDLIYDYIDYGNAFAEVIWVDESHVDPVSGERETTYVGPKVRRISPFDHTFDPTAVDYDSAPKFTRYLQSIGELKKDIMTRPDLGYNEDTVAKIIKRRQASQAFSDEDLNKAEGYTADGFGSFSEYLGSHLVEIIEFEGDWYDIDNDELHENKIITIVDGQFILRIIDNPSWFGKSNKVHVGWRDRPDNLYAMGPLANIVGLQYRVDHLENLKADALDQTIRPPRKIIGDVEPFVWAPGEDIHVPEDGDVVPMPPNPAAFQVNNEIGFLLSLMEEMAGAPKQAAGIRTPGEKTKFEVQTLENNAGRLFHSKTSKFEIKMLEKCMNLFLELARRNITTKDVVKVLDSDFGVANFVTITKDDVVAKGKIRPMGARHFAARAQLLQSLNEAHGGALGPLLNPHTSRIALTKLVEETLGLTKYQLYRENIGVTEDSQTQQLVQQAQIDLAGESGTPLEENLI
jgi:hypothetical protein